MSRGTESTKKLVIMRLHCWPLTLDIDDMTYSIDEFDAIQRIEKSVLSR